MIRNLPVPLPALTEQHRIVARVDEVMALCDRLEAQLTARVDVAAAFTSGLVSAKETADA